MRGEPAADQHGYRCLRQGYTKTQEHGEEVEREDCGPEATHDSAKPQE